MDFLRLFDIGETTSVCLNDVNGYVLCGQR